MQNTSSEYDSVTIASSSHRIVGHNYGCCQTIIPKTMKVIRVNTIHPDCIDGCHAIALNYLSGSPLVIDFLILSKSTTSNRWCAIAWRWSVLRPCGHSIVPAAWPRDGISSQIQGDNTTCVCS